MGVYKGQKDLQKARQKRRAPRRNGVSASPPPAASAGQNASRPAFPVGVFPNKLAAFIRRVAVAIGGPIDYASTAALVVAGAAVGASRAVLLKEGWTERPAMYACLVGPPSSAKTPAIRLLADPLLGCQHRMVVEHREARRRYEVEMEEYQQALRGLDDDEERPEKPAPPGPLGPLVMNDATVEAVGCCLEENPRGLLLHRDEFVALVEGLDMYRGRGNDRRFYLSAWSGEVVKVDRKSTHGEPIWIPKPFLSVLGGIQPDLLDRLQMKRGDDDGFVARLLFAYPEAVAAPPWSDYGVNDDDAAGWAAVVGKLLALRPARVADGECVPVVLRLDKGGKAAWVRWHNALNAEINSPDTPEKLRGVLGKFRSYGARFALTLRLLREACGTKVRGGISAADVAGAVKLCAYFQAHARAIFGRLSQGPEDRNCEALVKWMVRKSFRECAPRDVSRAGLSGVTSASQAERLFRAAADRGHGRVEEVSGNRRALRFILDAEATAGASV